MQLKCVRKKVLSNGVVEVKLRDGNIEFRFNASRDLAKQYEIGKYYSVELSEDFNG